MNNKIVWTEQMVKEYAAALGMSMDEVVELMEQGLDYSVPYCYQAANFPGPSSDNLFGVFDNYADFRAHNISGKGVAITEMGLGLIQMFEPVPKDGGDG